MFSHWSAQQRIMICYFIGMMWFLCCMHRHRHTASQSIEIRTTDNWQLTDSIFSISSSSSSSSCFFCFSMFKSIDNLISMITLCEFQFQFVIASSNEGRQKLKKKNIFFFLLSKLFYEHELVLYVLLFTQNATKMM